MLLTLNKMTKEQKKAVVDKKEGGYEKWENGLKRIGTIGIFEKNTAEEKISKMTKCDTHTKIGVSSDGKCDRYFNFNWRIKLNFTDEKKN